MWELLCRRAGSALPPPSRSTGHQGADLRSVLRQWRSGQGSVLAYLGSHPARSLRLLARCRRRHRAWHAGWPVGLGHAWPRSDLPGVAHHSAAGLAARWRSRLSGRSAVGDLRDLHHLDLADHHQLRLSVSGIIPQDLSQRRRRGAAQSGGVFLESHTAGGCAIFSPVCAWYRPIVGSRSSRLKR